MYFRSNMEELAEIHVRLWVSFYTKIAKNTLHEPASIKYPINLVCISIPDVVTRWTNVSILLSAPWKSRAVQYSPSEKISFPKIFIEN